MITPLVLSTIALAAPPPAATFDRAAATPGETVTVTIRNVPQRSRLRLYLVETSAAAAVRRATDRRLHYVGAARTAGRTARLSFRTPPLDGRYVAWCKGCRSGGAIRITMPSATATSCPATIEQSGPPPGLTGTWHGNGALWTGLPDDGTLTARPEDVRPDGSIWTKWFWYADGIAGQLTLAGRRLDGESPPLLVHRVNRGSQSNFLGDATWATPITFAAPGCWLLTARVADPSFAVTLSFVMKVATP